jgi:glycosyltransferase involved in cell wall biosynthesis
MEILEVVSGAEINGAVVHCALLSKELARRGHSVTLLCRPGAKVMGLVADAPVALVESDMHRFPFDELRRVRDLARERGVEVIHTHMTRAHNFGVGLRRFARIPCVATAHSHIVQPLTWMFNDYVIAVSAATQRFQLRRNFVRPDRIETVHGFMDYDRQAAVPADARSIVRAELGLDDTTPVFGIIGDIVPRKGHLYLVRALAEIVQRSPNVRMIVVGDPKRKMGHQYNELVRAEAKRLGVDSSIVWAGYRTDVLNVMRALDVYVMASLDEMFPVAALEAMAARLPIVATRVGGIPECLTDEESALLAPPEQSSELATRILRLLTDPALAARIARRAHDLARDQFSVRSQAPRIEAVFDRVIERFRSEAGPSRAVRSGP